MIAFETERLRGDVLLRDGGSHVTYHEYAAFAEPRPPQLDLAAGETTDTPTSSRPEQVRRSIVSEDHRGDELAALALRKGFGLDRQGKFKPLGDVADSGLQGRVRHILCRRRDGYRPDGTESQGLQLTDTDYDAINPHPATMQYVRRVTTEAVFWDRRRENLSIILCFSSDPRPPYDFLSLTYSIPQRTATMLIRQSYDGFIHHPGQLDEYSQRMQACEAVWAHPLVTPVIMLQAQFALSEEAVTGNGRQITVLEQDVEHMAGFESFETRGPKRMLSNFSGVSGRSFVHPKRPTELMKSAHDAFKESVRLLDTIRWMERAVSVLLQAGDALEDVLAENMKKKSAKDTGSASSSSTDQTAEDPISAHWYEIRQYLESLRQLCKSLETDRHMLEIRCKAQIDIIYAKMQQEDNILTARMAVTSTRDSSSLKALAIITALFLPGEFVASMMGMSMFEIWNDGEYEDVHLPPPPPKLWIYWVIAIPLTLAIFFLWRLWWVAQDRFFRTHLSKELSEERFWTEDRRPRKLEHGFVRDFFTLSARRDERSEALPATEGLPFSMTPAATKQLTKSTGFSPLGPGSSL
ncbi:hypothetical protein QBC47DRAFT_448698 [Echria macrotheca]|uniref:Uncharacterized protein n=1 Tax=Echria macrotheca TaxID=438768 RepID=A0AAJ0BMS0_9PEZI|nr:hypothetical protein QBC47DRAFT_448698 [Echria macrotheca]